MIWNFSKGYSKIWYNLYSKWSYKPFKVQYFAAQNSHYYTFFPKLKRNLAKIANFSFSMKTSIFNTL